MDISTSSTSSSDPFAIPVPDKIPLFKNVIDNDGLLLSRYQSVKLLGSGGFGEVYEAIDTVKNRDVVVKKIDISKKEVRILTEKTEYKYYAELKKLIQYGNEPGCDPNLICYRDFFRDQNNIYIIMDYFEGGELGEWIDNRRDILDPLSLEVIFLKLTRAIKSLHEYGIAHRDIKPENVLIREDSTATNLSDKYIIKIIDFGLTCYSNLRYSCKSVSGTPDYMSPEAFSGNNDIFMAKVGDIYSLGLTFQYISTRTNSQTNIARDYARMKGKIDVGFGKFLNKQEIKSKYKWDKNIDGLSDEMKIFYNISYNQLIEDMVRMDYTLRPNTNDILDILSNNVLYKYNDKVYNKYRLCMVMKANDIYTGVSEGNSISMQMSENAIKNIIEKYTPHNYVSVVDVKNKRRLAIYLGISTTSSDRDIRKTLEKKFGKIGPIKTLKAMAQHFYDLYLLEPWDRLEALAYYNFLLDISNGKYLKDSRNKLAAKGITKI